MSTIIKQPAQATVGYGSCDYSFKRFTTTDNYQTETGYFLYEPVDFPANVKANVVVFMHGYGAINPMVYGKWIKHLVGNGNIVIFPRYQRNILAPAADLFPINAATAIKNAIAELVSDSNKHVQPNLENITFIGHSYGGATAANLAVSYREYEIPKPKAVMLCQPGTGPLKGGRLDSYEAMDSDINLVVIVGEQDYIVGDEMGTRVFMTAKNILNKIFIRHVSDSYGSPAITAMHSEPYCMDADLDNGYRNYTFWRASRTSKVDVIDYNGYWKIADALMDCTFGSLHCDQVFSPNTPLKNLGHWSDGTAIKPMQVYVMNPSS